jgi:small subunit ribosomal protein S6
MKLYETGFLISPGLSEEEIENVISRLAEVVSQKNGKMVKLEKWGKRRMAYRIGKFDEAFYVFFHYEGEPEIPQELGRRFRQMDTVLRYLTLRKESRENIRRKGKGRAEARERERAQEEPGAEEADLKAEKMPARERTSEEEYHG